MADSVSSRSAEGFDFALHCRGDVRLYRGAADCTPKSKKGRALLAILAAEQRPLSRVKIVDLLWSDRQEEQARASLRTLLADLKQHFNSEFDDLLVVDRERIALAPGVRTDLHEPALAPPAGELFEGLDHIDPELDEWLRVERVRWRNALLHSQMPAPLRSRLAFSRAVLTRQWTTAFAAVMLVIAIGALWWWTRPSPPRPDPVIAVMPFRDATGQRQLLAEGLAEELRINLAERGRIQVIGRQSSETATVQQGGAEAARRILGAGHIVEGSILPGAPTKLSIRLVDTKRGRTVWNLVTIAQGNSIVAGSKSIADVIADQITQTVEQAGPAEAFAADPAAYMALFRARQLLLMPSPDSKVEARKVLSPVLQRYPNFVPALGAMAEATIAASDHLSYGGPIPFPRARAEALMHARKAVRLAPEYAPSYLALGAALLDSDDAIAALRKAVELSPGNHAARHALARQLWFSFRPDEALIHARVAVELNPVRVRSTVVLLRSLYGAGRQSEMAQAAQGFFRSSDNPRDRLLITSELAGDTGDLADCLVSALRAHAMDRADFYTGQFVSNAYLFLEEPRLALPFTARGSVSEAVINKDLAALIKQVRALGADFWGLASETDAAAEFLLSRGRADVLLDSYRNAGSKFRSASRSGFIQLLIALRQADRQADAEKLFGENRSWVLGLAHDPDSNIARAEVLAVQGRKSAAIAVLESTLQTRWWNGAAFYTSVFDRVAFRPLRNEPRFKRLRSEQSTILAREQAKAIASLRTAGLIKEANILRAATQNE